jgi:adenylylsulfate kinase-like enzyme
MMARMTETIRVLIINGPVGVGKSTTANTVSELLEARGVPHAVIDMDYLRSVYPRPEDDPFHVALGYRNLAAVWQNFFAAGARIAIIPSVVESSENIEAYRQAIPGAEITVVRLSASVETRHARLARRELGTGLAWHTARTEELQRLLEERQLDDAVIDTEGKTALEVAGEVLALSGLLI